jgi:hypothetical protein
MEQEPDLELEGPFLTLADFVRAQEVRERLRRRNKKPRSKTETKLTQQTSTFELTATGHEETDHDQEGGQSSHASDGRPGTSMSMATTAQTIHAPKKKMLHKMAQTVPQQGPQDPGDKFVEFRCERWREVCWSFFRHGTPKISFQCRLEQESSKY